MSEIDLQIVGTSRASDNGLLERIESNPSPSVYEMLALITRCADIIERADCVIEWLEDEQYTAFDALDTLRAKLSDCIDVEETAWVDRL